MAQNALARVVGVEGNDHLIEFDTGVAQPDPSAHRPGRVVFASDDEGIECDGVSQRNRKNGLGMNKRNTNALPYLSETRGTSAIPIWCVTKRTFTTWRKKQPQAVQRWLKATGFEPTPGGHAIVPAGGRAKRAIAGVVLGVRENGSPWDYAGLPVALRRGTYRIETDISAAQGGQAAIGWGLGTYAFSRFKNKAAPPMATLVVPGGCDRDLVRRTVASTFMVRDLINTPALDMGPAELSEAAKELGRAFGARVRVITGAKLLDQNFPAIHAVGQASTRAPRLIDLRWGKKGPLVTLVGKGVCFDSGGLDLKSAAGMRLMKKDMGGAANVLGLAHMIMDAGLELQLRVLIPAVENSVSGNAIRPGDIIASRKGLSIEIGNTDAEGRVVLADALALADEEGPDLVVDLATLTGAARVAMGPDISPFFTDDEDLAADLARHSGEQADPLWRLPLWAPYRKMIDSPIADINNAGESPFAGAITAALFLKDFVSEAKSWVHLDIFGWNPGNRPGRPKGGEAMGIRTLFALLQERYG